MMNMSRKIRNSPGMLRKLKGKPLWYKLWSGLVALAAIFLLVKVVFMKLGSIDYIIMVFVFISLLFDYFLFPDNKAEV